MSAITGVPASAAEMAVMARVDEARKPRAVLVKRGNILGFMGFGLGIWWGLISMDSVEADGVERRHGGVPRDREKPLGIL